MQFLFCAHSIGCRNVRDHGSGRSHEPDGRGGPCRWHGFPHLGAPCASGRGGGRAGPRCRHLGDGLATGTGRCPGKLGDGSWVGFLPGIGEGDPYLFFIRGDVDGDTSGDWKRDPFARELSREPDFPNSFCLVRDPATYPWHDAGWHPPAFSDLVIYQLHVGTWWAEGRDGTDVRAKSGGTFLDVAARLDHLVGLGVNAIQMLPIQEFETRNSLGYNLSDLFAPRWPIASGPTTSIGARGGEHRAGALRQGAAHPGTARAGHQSAQGAHRPVSPQRDRGDLRHRVQPCRRRRAGLGPRRAQPVVLRSSDERRQEQQPIFHRSGMDRAGLRLLESVGIAVPDRQRPVSPRRVPRRRLPL